MQEFERRFSEDEQKRIVRLAARLQKEGGDSINEAALVQAAAEAGIDAAYVRQAITRLSHVPVEDGPVRLQIVQAIVPLLLVSDWLGMFSMMADRLQGWAGLQWWLLFSICFSLGAVLSKTPRARISALAITAASTLVVAALCGPFVALVQGHVSESWPHYLVNATIAQLVSTFCGGAAGRLLAKVFRKGAPASQPT